MQRRAIDLNCDLGEGFGVYRLTRDEELMGLVSSINVACGFHAGDPLTMKRTVSTAVSRGVKVGAHPGLPDLLGFGRRKMEIAQQELEAYLIFQVGALEAIARDCGAKLQHVKAHGALYTSLAASPALSETLVDTIARLWPDLVLVAPSGSITYTMAREKGIRVAAEAFADRAYNDDGMIVPRNLPGSVIADPVVVAERAVRLVIEGKIETITGGQIQIRADTLCVHGDTPNAEEIVKTISSLLRANDVAIAPMSAFL